VWQPIPAGEREIAACPIENPETVIFITARSPRSVPSSTMGRTGMLIYEDLVELARMCARNARITTSRDVADELWRMAKEYQAQAAEMGGKVGLLNVPSIGTMDCALAVEALGLKKFGDKGNMTKPEIDFLIDYIIPLKKTGHFRAFWENFGQSVNLMVNGEVALESMWSPAVAAIQAEGVPCVYAFPKEGMRGWHGGLSISAKVKGKQLDQAYEYINWWLAGWPAAFVARQGYYHSIPENAKKYLEPVEWDYWYMGNCKKSGLRESNVYAGFCAAPLTGFSV
jgi:hypothetical protein